MQAAEQALADSSSRPLPPLQREAVLFVVGADTDYGRERVAQYVRAAGWDVWELGRSRCLMRACALLRAYSHPCQR